MEQKRVKKHERATPIQVYIGQLRKQLTLLGVDEQQSEAIVSQAELLPHILELNVETIAKTFRLLNEIGDDPNPKQFKKYVKEHTKERESKGKIKGKVGKTARREYLSSEEDLIKQKKDIFRYMQYIRTQREKLRAQAVEEQEEKEEVVSEEEQEQTED
jgi:hypothetical protein